MNKLTAEIRTLARRLIALESTRDHAAASRRVCECLRVPLARLAGIAGYRSLLSRALALAKTEVESLKPVQVLEDGSISGLDAVAVGEGGVAVVAQLLALLVTFIGEPLTKQLVTDTWPAVAADKMDGGVGGQP